MKNRLSPTYWPMENWRTSSPEEQDMDSVKLDGALSMIVEKHYPIHCALVVRHGHLVWEKYPSPNYTPLTLHILHSATKSFTSSLIGIAIDKGYINNINQKVVDFFPEKKIANLNSQKKKMTLENLLTMTSGLEWDELSYPYDDSRNDLKRALGNYVQIALDKPMAYEPGFKWNYNTGCTQILSAIITKTTGRRTDEFAREFLFEPMGIIHFNWPTDMQGIPYGGSELHLTPRDMAKFGYLFLNNGNWYSKQLISTDWIVKSTKLNVLLGAQERLTVKIPLSTDGTPLSIGYGYLWWMALDYGVYYASGRGRQYICVIPKLDMVVVITADMEGVEGEYTLLYTLLHDFILPACVNGSY